MKAFSIKDGCGIHDILIPAGITPVIITGRKSKILENRCAEIGIDEITPYDGTSIDGIRLTFHEHEIDESFVETLHVDVI